ncbi:Thiol-disulfide oxidoreductase resA [Bacteroidales bacterium Barb4]|nr:Thiol-disulfide oxidoreductase resA [Bacteroidales bacterium Barb4]
MKQFRLLVLAMVSAACLFGCRQTPQVFVINGEIANVKEGRIYLKKFRNKMFFDTDTAEVRDGRFTFTGSVDQPLLYGLAVDGMDYPDMFFLENTTLTVRMDGTGKAFTAEGSPANDIFQANTAASREEGFDIDSLVSLHPASPAAAFYLYRYFTYQLTLDELKAVRAKLSPALDSSPYVTDLDAIIGQLEQVQIGQTAPEFTLPDTAGNPVALSAFRGSYVLLDFWASWCPPCRQENPSLVKVYNEYKNRNFTIVGISLDYSQEHWLKGIADDHLAWTHVSDLNYWDSEIPSLYGVRGIPANVLLDPEGVIIAKNITGDKLPETLDNFLNTAIRNAVALQMETYPKSTLKDLYKSFFQDEFGPGHIVSDTAAAGNYIRREMESFTDVTGKVGEPLGWKHNFYRVNLSVLKKGEVPYEVYFDAFIRSVNGINPMPVEEWRKEWSHIETVIRSMNLNLPDYDADKAEIDKRLSQGNYTGHHSAGYEEAYAPHYRIVSRALFEEKIAPLL